jgi:hypothetical protein
LRNAALPQSLALDGANIKALYRRAAAQISLCNCKEARADLQVAPISTADPPYPTHTQSLTHMMVVVERP